MRDETLTITIEQHDHTVTIYAAGVLSIASSIRLMRVCEQLPRGIRMARIDLRAVHEVEEDAMTVLQSRLQHWRGRHARIHLTGPAGQPPPTTGFRTSGR